MMRKNRPSQLSQFFELRTQHPEWSSRQLLEAIKGEFNMDVFHTPSLQLRIALIKHHYPNWNSFEIARRTKIPHSSVRYVFRYMRKLDPVFTDQGKLQPHRRVKSLSQRLREFILQNPTMPPVQIAAAFGIEPNDNANALIRQMRTQLRRHGHRIPRFALKPRPRPK